MKMQQIYEGLLDGTLVPRYHSGVGMMQVYLTEDIRLHVFHPELPPKLEAFGNRHNHRFDMESHVLLGTIVDLRLRLDINCLSGGFSTYTVKPAHHGDTPVPVRGNYAYDLIVKTVRRYEAGKSYHVALGEYHETRAEGLTVTLMRKSNQVEAWAKIAACWGQQAIHAMENPPSQVLMNQLFFSALRKLSPEAVRFIESQTGD